MDAEKLRFLIEKYFEGETSLDEEASIKQAFKENPGLQKEFGEAALFMAFSLERDLEPKNIEVSIGEEESETKVRHISFGTFLRWAAVLVIVASTVFLFLPTDNSRQGMMEDSFENPELAYVEAKKALAMVSEKMNQGRSGAAVKISKMNTVIPVKD